jgi:thioesterase domain-containing protein
LLAAEFAVHVRKSFNRDLPLTALSQRSTLADLARLLEEKSREVSRSLVPLQPHGSKAPFFCVHGLGGEVLCLEKLAHHLGDERPFYGLQVPRAGDVGGPAGQVERLATAYLAEVLAVQPEGPYFLGGYSFGGAVAYEMAQQLRRQGRDVAFLAIIDQRRPNLTPGFTWDSQAFAGFLRNIPNWVRDELGTSQVRPMLSRLRSKVGMYGKRIAGLLGGSRQEHLPPDVREVLDISRIPQDFGKQMQARYAALRSYVPQPYLGRVMLFRARSQPLLRWQDRAMGWGELVLGGLAVKEVPGPHDRLLAEPHVQILASELRTALAHAERES